MKSLTELRALIKLTVINCPLPCIADLLQSIRPGDVDAETMFDFIKSHYTRKQMLMGIEEYQKCTSDNNQ
jgi:hypothetical protein